MRFASSRAMIPSATARNHHRRCRWRRDPAALDGVAVSLSWAGIGRRAAAAGTVLCVERRTRRGGQDNRKSGCLLVSVCSCPEPHGPACRKARPNGTRMYLRGTYPWAAFDGVAVSLARGWHRSPRCGGRDRLCVERRTRRGGQNNRESGCLHVSTRAPEWRSPALPSRCLGL